MKKHTYRLIAVCLVFILTLGIFPISISASTQASDYISWYSVGLSQGSSNGQLTLSYNIVGTGTMDTIGVSKIVVYKADGTKYRTIYGTVANGLLEQNTFSALGVYHFTVATGYSYYCVVTFYSSKNGGYDTRTVTTRTVVAPIIPTP